MFLRNCMFIALMLAAVATSTSSVVKDQLILEHAPACKRHRSQATPSFSTITGLQDSRVSSLPSPACYELRGARQPLCTSAMAFHFTSFCLPPVRTLFWTCNFLEQQLPKYKNSATPFCLVPSLERLPHICMGSLSVSTASHYQLRLLAYS